MKKFAIALVVIVIAAWAVATLTARGVRRTASAQEWPMSLGTLDSVPRRYPNVVTTAAAHQLDPLAIAAGIDTRGSGSSPDELAEYVREELRRVERIAEPAPASIAVKAEAIAALRAHLLSGRDLAWQCDLSRGVNAPMPNFLLQMRVHWLLVASALERARNGDTGAWDDLRAAWELSRDARRRPEMIAAIIGFTISRNVAVAARKMPSPPPPWFEEVRTFDYERAMLAAFQADTWMFGLAMKEYAKGSDATTEAQRWRDRAMAPYILYSRADYLRNQHAMAMEVASFKGCDFDVAGYTQRESEGVARWNRMARALMASHGTVWQRLFRFRAELELTEHAHGLRSGTVSDCSDGQWIVRPAVVRFNRDIPWSGADRGWTPLEIRR